MNNLSDENSCGSPGRLLDAEWLDTNGLGAYASSTFMNCHTRSYHGLLVANLPGGRYVLLSKFEDSLLDGQEEHFFSCHQYPSFFFPQVQHCLSAFEHDWAPRFTYRIGDIVLKKTIMLVQGDHTLLVRYHLDKAPPPLFLRLKPFLAFRSFHALARKEERFGGSLRMIDNGFSIRPYPHLPALCIKTDSPARFLPDAHWYHNFEYPRERERGYAWREDLYLPGVLEVPLSGGDVVTVAVTLEQPLENIRVAWSAEKKGRREGLKRNEGLVERFPEEDRGFVRQLLKAGGQFLIRTPDGRPSIIAGYHWFDDWGRDTLISLPGLTFCRGLVREGVDILDAIGGYELNGLLPNFFSAGDGRHSYNSVDASLWFFWAVQQMLVCNGDLKTVHGSLWPVMKRIVAAFMKGTIYHIHMADSGLLFAGAPDTHLTWMDARVKGRPVTPRWGYAVEINALWYNALCFTRQLAGQFGEDPLCSEGLLARLSASFRDMFWIEKDAYLADVSRGDFVDPSLRPNQIFAVSLPFSPLLPYQAEAVVEKVRERLLTPVGLRTLSPLDGSYRGTYTGDEAERDGAYHKGTVWPWLLAPFGEALLKVSRDREGARMFLLGHLRSFLGSHLPVAGVGSVSEIFDGDPPHAPQGCIAQAWSVAELTRLYMLVHDAVPSGN